MALTLGAGVENLTLSGSGHINGIGNTLDNQIIGNDGDNSLTGGDGNDSLSGGLGKAKADVFQAGLHGRTMLGSLTLAAALGYVLAAWFWRWWISSKWRRRSKALAAGG